LREKLSNLQHFLHGSDDIDPLIRMARAHYQFEAIHPFTDGNGRTGCILNTLFLIDKKEAWLLYMLTAVEETSLWTTAKIRSIRDLMDVTIEHVS
jgi:Fic family protein